MKYAFLFPGMVSQQVGMGKDLAARWEVARRVFEEANDILGYDFTRICFNGSMEELIAGYEIRWLTMFTMSIASLRILEQEGVQASRVAGPSGGVFASLVAARSVTYADALRFLQKRGQLFETIPDDQKGAMFVVISANKEVQHTVQMIAQEEQVQVALYNSDTQIVFAGTQEEIQRLQGRVTKVRGIYIPKPERFSVNNAHHSSLLSVIQAEWVDLVKSLPITDARVPVALSIAGEFTCDRESIREDLLLLNVGTVRWQQLFDQMVKQRVDGFFETGACHTLTKLARAWIESPCVMPCGTCEEIDAALRYAQQQRSEEAVFETIA